MMLSQLLVEEYTYITEPDEKITARCIFYPCQDSKDYVEPVKIYGLPCWNITSAKETVALKVLEYMNSDLEIKLHDYNYSDKAWNREEQNNPQQKNSLWRGSIWHSSTFQCIGYIATYNLGCTEGKYSFYAGNR